MAAKYYIYRNLHKDCFSVKYKGKVINHVNYFVGHDVEFRVSEAGRQRVLDTLQRNVHAYVVCSSYDVLLGDLLKTDEMKLVYYNPFELDMFVLAGTEIPVMKSAICYGINTKIYI